MMLYFRAKAEEVVLKADNRLEVYRRIKGLIEDKGIVSAFDAWKSLYKIPDVSHRPGSSFKVQQRFAPLSNKRCCVAQLGCGWLRKAVGGVW